MILLWTISLIALGLPLLSQSLRVAPSPVGHTEHLQWRRDNATNPDVYINGLVQNMTIADLGSIVGPKADNGLYNATMRLAPDSPIGVIHDWYSLNTSHYNALQELNLNKSRIKIPLMHFGECLHGVGSFKQSMFPQSISMSASFDTDLVYRVGRAIGTEARSIGIHACFSPVLDIGQDLRWGRVQEAWGEDKILTSHMGVAYSSGLSKNGSWAEHDAVIPVMKHFAAHGAPQSGLNAAPFMGHGNRQLLQELLIPFKAAVQQGGVRGVMMSYNEFDDIPSVVNPTLYSELKSWGFNGFVIADDTGMQQLEKRHRVASSPADAIMQWFQAGGMIQFYDYPLDTYLNATRDLVNNGSLKLETLQTHVRDILRVKWDLGLLQNPFVPADIDPFKIVRDHKNLTLEAARKSIVLLKNTASTLPIKPTAQGISKVALVGPFADTLNFGDYSGSWGQAPADEASTIRQGMMEHLEKSKSGVRLVSSWGANSFEYNSQYVIPAYLLSANGTTGGLLATYYAETNFTQPLVRQVEVPTLDWGIYPPPGLPSNNFSAVWEGSLQSPVDTDVDGWIGLAVGSNTTARLFIDDQVVVEQGYSTQGSSMSNIMPFPYTQANHTAPPTGGVPFTFRKGATHHIKIEYQAYTTYQRIENWSSINSHLALFWNLVSRTADPVEQAVQVARDADLIVLALGANWNSDGENGDRATLGLAPSQDDLARAIFALNKTVVLVLEGGRPFAIPKWYDASAAVLSAFFSGQAGGQAIADVLFGSFNPGGRLPLSIPRHVGQLPVYYNYKPTAHDPKYIDEESTPSFPFGYGLSYTTFVVAGLRASVTKLANSSLTNSMSFTSGNNITFSIDVQNNGTVAGSYVAQVYLLGRVSAIVQPVKQLVAFTRVYLEPGAKRTVIMELEVNRYLPILNRSYKWELERGEYTFSVLEHGGAAADTSNNITLTCT